MKEARFTELLNLYLDHRLSASEAAELEAEVMRNPARRRAYDSYCRMQRACGLLFESERESATSSFALARALNEVERKLAGPAGNGGAHRPVVWLGWGTAAAACVVMVSLAVTLRVRAPGESGAPVLAEVQAPAVDAGASGGASVVMTAAAPLATTRVAGGESSDQQLLNATADALAQQWSREAAQRWIDAEAAALVEARLVDDERFELRRVSTANTLPSFQTRQPEAGNPWRGEVTAYQFRR